MRPAKLPVGLLLFFLCVAANAQTAPCRDAADEPHHQVILENSAMRVLLLELPRVASTEPSCYSNPYVFIVLGEGKSSTTIDGQGTLSRDWDGSEAQLVFAPQKQVLRNESGRTFREVIVELRRGVVYDPLSDRYSNDLFPGDLGTLKPTWTVSSIQGGVRFSKVQLAAGDKLSLNGDRYLLIALTDLSLQQTTHGVQQQIDVQAQDTNTLSTGGASEVANTARTTARFILIEY